MCVVSLRKTRLCWCFFLCGAFTLFWQCKRHQALKYVETTAGGSDCIKICVGFTPSTGTPFSLCTGHLQHHMSMCVFVLTHWHSSLQRTRIKKDSWRKRKRKALFDLHGDSVCAIQFTSAWSWVFPFYSARYFTCKGFVSGGESCWLFPSVPSLCANLTGSNLLLSCFKLPLWL